MAIRIGFRSGVWLSRILYVSVTSDETRTGSESVYRSAEEERARCDRT